MQFNQLFDLMRVGGINHALKRRKIHNSIHTIPGKSCLRVQGNVFNAKK